MSNVVELNPPTNVAAAADETTDRLLEVMCCSALSDPVLVAAVIYSLFKSIGGDKQRTKRLINTVTEMAAR